MKCATCIHSTVCDRKRDSVPCGLYIGHCEDCYYWNRVKAFASGNCELHSRRTYEHHYCGSYMDPEWMKTYLHKEKENDGGRETEQSEKG